MASSGTAPRRTAVFRAASRVVGRAVLLGAAHARTHARTHTRARTRTGHQSVAFPRQTPEYSSTMARLKVSSRPADGGSVAARKRPRKQLAVPAKKRPVPPAPSAAKERKPHRFRPGTVAFKEIRRQQGNHPLPAFRKLPFERLVREIAQDFRSDVRFTKGALDALREISEDAIAHAFQLMQTMLAGTNHTINADGSLKGQLKGKITPNGMTMKALRLLLWQMNPSHPLADGSPAARRAIGYILPLQDNKYGKYGYAKAYRHESKASKDPDAPEDDAPTRYASGDLRGVRKEKTAKKSAKKTKKAAAVAAEKGAVTADAAGDDERTTDEAANAVPALEAAPADAPAADEEDDGDEPMDATATQQPVAASRSK